MSDEQVSETNPQEDEYVKPNPADNPRNISLNEIAKKVADQHKVEFSETADTIDEDGVVTPAPEPAVAAEAVQDPEPSSAASEPSSTTTKEPGADTAPAATAPETPQEAIDPNKTYKVKIDGQEVEVPGQKIIDAGYRTFQKETAADYRLKVAEGLMLEAQRRLEAAQPQQPQQAPQQAQPTEPSDAELAKALQFGTEAESAEAIKVLRQRGQANPQQIAQFVTQQARVAARDEAAFQDALGFVKSEYGDLLSNDYLKRLFFTEESRYRAPKERGGLGDTRAYREVYKEIGDGIRKALNLQKPGTQVTTATGAPSTSTASGRQTIKAALPPAPRMAATRLQEATGVQKAKTASEIIAGMAAARGKTQLTSQRKE